MARAKRVMDASLTPMALATSMEELMPTRSGLWMKYLAIFRCAFVRVAPLTLSAIILPMIASNLLIGR